MRVTVAWFCAALLRNCLCPGKTQHIIKIPFSSLLFSMNSVIQISFMLFPLSLKSLIQFIFFNDAFVSPLITGGPLGAYIL